MVQLGEHCLPSALWVAPALRFGRVYRHRRLREKLGSSHSTGSKIERENTKIDADRIVPWISVPRTACRMRALLGCYRITEENKLINIKRRALIGGLLSWISLQQRAAAQSNLPRRIALVVPFGPGSGVDFNGRLIAEKLSERLQEPIVVENRPGAGGMTGDDWVAKGATRTAALCC